MSLEEDNYEGNVIFFCICAFIVLTLIFASLSGIPIFLINTKAQAAGAAALGPNHPVIQLPRQQETYCFGTAGDFYEDNNVAPITAKNLASNCPVFIGLGDYTHKNASAGVHRWGTLMPPIRWGTIGNHENCDGCSAAWLKYFGMNSWNQPFSYGGVTIIPLNSENGTFTTLATAGQAAKERGDWIITIMHKPIFTAASVHPPDEGHLKGSVRIIDRLGVVLSLSGHNHNYQRSYPMRNGTVTAPRNIASSYTLSQGTIWAVVGTGGGGNYPLSQGAIFNQKQFTNVHGFLKIDVSPRILKGQFIANNKTVLDSFSVSR
jgi:hypothetical protein